MLQPHAKGVSGVRMGGLPTLPCSVSPTASGRPSSHPEQPRHSAGWQQIIHVGLGKWKMPCRLSLGCGVGRQPASPASLQGAKCSPGAPVAQGSQRVVHFPLQGGGEAMPAAVFAEGQRFLATPRASALWRDFNLPLPGLSRFGEGAAVWFRKATLYVTFIFMLPKLVFHNPSGVNKLSARNL